MTLTLALAINAIAAIALVGALAWFMSRPTKLTPHISARHDSRRLAAVPAQAAKFEQQESIAA
ncbi:MAG TPA: hypothetical protein VKG38_12320 [Solirubrobacteraceae bacterium]|nr:hypothetical protein [Solirubrobacteraceae bacterium]